MKAKSQAPKGGCLCLDNKEWYEGGQFLPSTDLPKGVMKKVKKVASVLGNISKVEVKKSFSGYAVFVSYTSGISNKLVFNCIEASEANSFAKAIIKEKEVEYEAQGLMPHPSVLILIDV